MTTTQIDSNPTHTGEQRRVARLLAARAAQVLDPQGMDGQGEGAKQDLNTNSAAKSAGPQSKQQPIERPVRAPDIYDRTPQQKPATYSAEITAKMRLAARIKADQQRARAA